MMPPDRARHAWRIHYAFLVAIAIVYAVCSWDGWFPPPDRTLNLKVIAAIGFLFVILVYAFVTTLAMFWVARYRWSSLLIHGCAIAVAGMIVYGKHQDEQRRRLETAAVDEERIRRNEERLKLGTCIHVELVKLSLGPPMRASLTLVNHDCPVQRVLRDVDLSAFQGGKDWIFSLPFEARRARSSLEIGARRTFTLEEAMPESDHLSPADWSFRTNIDVEDPDPMLLCYVTPGAPATSGCNSIDRTTVEPGP